jgi:serine protease Do
MMKKILFSSLAVLLVISGAVAISGNSFLSETTRTSPLKSSKDRDVIMAMQNTYHNIYNEYKDSVVFISTEKTVTMQRFNPFMDDPAFREFFNVPDSRPQTRKARGLGTGFLISSDGYICTNHHVVQNVDTVTVTVSDKDYEAEIIGSDQLTDIALIKIKSSDRSFKFKPVYFGDSEKVKVGDMVVAIGNPFGLDRTFTTGVVSATGRNQLDSLGNMHIQTDAAINQGNSGGPLINIEGEVIGVNRAIYSGSGGNVGIGFAIPVNIARDTLLELKEYGKVKRGFIGVNIANLTEDYAKQLGLEKNEGVLVGSVIKNGPAEKAGMKEGDVIVAIDNKPVKSFQELLQIVGNERIGKTIKVTVWRNKSRTNVWVTIKERP